MLDYIYKIFGIHEDGKVNKFNLDYRNSIFSNIIIPIMAFILLIHNNNKLISKSYSIYSQKKILYGLMPNVVSKILEFILTYINIFGNFVYSNYCLIIALLLVLLIVILIIGKIGLFNKFKIYNNKMMDKKGRIHGFDYITAYSNIINIIIFTMTDLWIIYSFSSIFLWNINTISKYSKLSVFLNSVYAIKLFINFIFKLFSITYYENYHNLNFNSFRELDNGKYNRFGVLDHKKIELSEDDNRKDLKNKHIYILKDRFSKDGIFLFVLINEYNKEELITDKVHYSTNLEEIQLVFDYMKKEYSK
ncbi:Uncharacterised protein [Anaerococcus prevotii]|uniref:Uncharacterized protein n=1 Tax=Anaerococcus prevotii (strain ATCC 9321 / DSM 20548 / JCM 6508 / NCTC 11806 / PC1) TaxID=525919 RepID=C7RE59_ANAPD|nr:hypothetical protein [Anaerococcus prevotii]ACV29472.1 hypothetical protein Apre_1449 [Anaerococcus prevotii DSM 20548]SUU95144.1 Uncharacterised protein [Anaerococcus prevotii]